MLTDKQILSYKPKAKQYKKSDTEGLSMYINPKGTKVFFFRYKWNDGVKIRWKTQPIGLYGKRKGEYTLTQAREKRDGYIDKLADGIDPSAAIDPGKTFKTVAKAWFTAVNLTDKDKTGKDFWSAKTQKNYKTRLNYAFKGFGNTPIAEVTSEDVLEVCRKIELRGKRDAAKRTRDLISRVMDYAYVYDVSKPIARALLPHKTKNFSFVEGADNIKKLRDDIRDSKSEYETKLALQFVFYTFCRQKMWRLAKWDEINGDTWNVNPENMKKKKPFIVPLSKQSIEILNKMRAITGDSEFIFSYAYNLGEPLSESTLGRALNRMGYKGKQCPHGLRHVASTSLNRLKKSHQHDEDAIELQLDHNIRGTRGVYNKYDAIDVRTPMMQDWADWLDGL
jgi:integrase